MPWLLLLHISALICWCGSLLYLPALINGAVGLQGKAATASFDPSFGISLPRDIFTLVATPAALLAIGAGTAVFLVEGIVAFWLLAKLTLVVGLVLVHMGVGLLIGRVERGQQTHVGRWSSLCGVTAALLMVTIIWLVLYKPLQEV